MGRPGRIPLAGTHLPVAEQDFSQYPAVVQDFRMVPDQGFQGRDRTVAHQPSLDETAGPDQNLGHVGLAGSQSVLIVRESGVLVEERLSDRLFTDVEVEGLVQPTDLCEEESGAEEKFRECVLEPSDARIRVHQLLLNRQRFSK